MSFRARLFLAFLVVAAAPPLGLALGVRSAVLGRLRADFAARAGRRVEALEAELGRRGAAIDRRLAALESRIREDNRLRGELRGEAPDPGYLLDWVPDAAELAGLDLLRLQEADGSVLSSAHFRNEYGRPGATPAPGRTTILQARSPSGPRLALVRARPVRLPGRRLALVGGEWLDRAFLESAAGSDELLAALRWEGGVLASDPSLEGDLAESTGVPEDHLGRTLDVPFLVDEVGGEGGARFVVAHSLAPLRSLRRRVERWFLVGGLAAVAVALLAAAWTSRRLSRPLLQLERKAARLDLDRLDIEFRTDRPDEIGRLERVMARMTERLRGSVAELRDAERRAALGDLARQVHHDVRNGLVPLRHALAHLAEAAHASPAGLPEAFEERGPQLSRGLEWLEELAGRYARLRPPTRPAACRLQEVVPAACAAVPRPSGARIRLDVPPDVPPVAGDPVSLRRIVENLVRNGIESLSPRGGSVEVMARRGEEGIVRLEVRDEGRGMDEETRRRVFEPFFTTREGGTGLGLAIVRRLAGDLGAPIRIASEPGAGTRVELELPVAAGEEERT